jgi:arginyl-tRNA synthetase
MAMREQITEALKKILGDLGIEVEPVLEFPADLAHGDYSTNVAMVGASKAKNPPAGGPKVLAEEIVKKLGIVEGVSKIEIAGPGFINFTLTRESYASVLQKTSIERDRWGSNDHVKGYKVMVEYAQPNPFKPFHIGHLMSTAIGESISRLVEYSGADIFRANYQGDIGLHIAKCIWGLQKATLDAGNIADLQRAYVMGSTAYDDDETAKAEINDLNKRLYAHDPALAAIYEKGRAASLKHFDDLYHILDTRFDHLFFESEIADRGIEIVRAGLKKGIFTESEGAVVYKGEEHGLHTRVFITKAGTPTYEAKEVALAEAKRKIFPFDLNVTTVAVEQDGYFKVVESALAELMPEMKGRYTHVVFGMMQLESGKMSSRRGNIITGESLIEDMRAAALAKMEGRELADKQSVVDAVAVAAIKYSILKQTKGKNIVFDPTQSLSLEGDSGPYLQYSYVRAMSVLAKAGAKNTTIYDSTSVPKEIPTFERLLPRFPDIVFRAAKEYEPHHVTTYLTELAGAFNSWYAGEKIIGSADETYKLELVKAFAQTMKNGLWLLGIEAPKKM